ncbi:hypothetical protein EJ03DRAFT_267180 [Teratosphaeria nubilosa]|uniref:Rhodopsin domain-containing protein n=1 Tax=Teratosphaeria nubilosa TaxID=161662 RepID=A0A6G1LHM5_9PEZI|nr:hypothetical protein EJ03DRAFT_267180 [Teratosphaeria nubilosa]
MDASSTTGPNWQAFAPITSTDHAGYIWVAVLYSLITSVLAAATRTWLKKNNLHQDDWLYLAATIALFGHVLSLIVALTSGLGTIPSPPSSRQRAHYTLAEYQSGSRATFSAAILLIISLAIAKCCVVIFQLRLLARDSKRIRYLCYALVGLFAAWGLGSVLGLSINCQVDWYITSGASTRCGQQPAKWTTITAFDVATEVALMAVPILIVWPLKMDRHLKIQVVSAFMFRIGVIALAIAHAVYVDRFQATDRPGMALTPVIIFAEAELCWSLISATIPNLKNFMKSFNTGFGHDFAFSTMEGSGQRRGSQYVCGSESDVRISKISNRRKSKGVRKADEFGGLSQRNDYEIAVSAGGMNEQMRPAGAVVGSSRAREIMVRKDVEMRIEENRYSGTSAIGLL